MVGNPERYELHYQDETHVETNPYLAKQWHRIGVQQRIASVGVNRRVTVFGSVEDQGRGRVEVICGGQNSACFGQYLTALDQRHAVTQREVFLVLDNASCHTSVATTQALTARAEWLHPLWLAKYSPHLNKKEREWRYLKRDVRGHLARDLRTFVDEIVDGLGRLGGKERLIIDAVPQWFLDGHRKVPTGRNAGRPVGAKDSKPRKSYTKRANLPALTYATLFAAPDTCVTLMRVVEVPPGLESMHHADEFASERDRQQLSLWQETDKLAAPLRAQGLDVAVAVRTGDATDEIIACAHEHDADLIIMTTHGAGGSRRWMLGSVTNKMLHNTAIPLLVIHPPPPGEIRPEPANRFDAVLIPLDGSTFAEQALPIAAEIANRCGARLELIRIVDDEPHDQEVDGVAANGERPNHQAVDLWRDNAQRYVHQIGERVAHLTPVVTGIVRVGNPAAVLSALLAVRPRALVVLNTQGNRGAQRWVFSDVAEKILTTAMVPTLVLRSDLVEPQSLHAMAGETVAQER